MMKRILTILIATTIALTAAAASASEILNATARRLTSADGVTATFTATSGDGTCDSGALQMAGNRFALRATGYASWFDGSNLWSYSAQAGETNLTEPTAAEIMEINPFAILSQWAAHYAAKITSTTATTTTIQLVPNIGSNTQIALATITIAKKTQLPQTIQVTFTNSATLSIVIKDIKFNPLKQSTFTYPASEYPAVEVIDLR